MNNTAIEFSINDNGLLSARLQEELEDKDSPLKNWGQFGMKYARELIEKMDKTINEELIATPSASRFAKVTFSHYSLEEENDEGVFYDEIEFGTDLEDERVYSIGENYPLIITLSCEEAATRRIGGLRTPVIELASELYRAMGRAAEQSLVRKSV